jgi:hypothetical protein
MPSSTSSSEPGRPDPRRAAEAESARALMQPGKPGDDPDVVQGPVIRPLPQRPLGGAAWAGVLLFLLTLGGWEAYWRDFGATPGYRNSDGLWARERRRIDQGEGDATVIVGSSRVLFDVQLPVWERRWGERPIQLALEGTSGLYGLESLAEDEDFTGRVLVGVTPPLFFADFSRRAGVLAHYRNETPSQRASQWLSMRLLEPLLAYYDPDFALFTVLQRQAWPPLRGVPNGFEVRKLSKSGPDRATRMWSKVENDPAYRELTRGIWQKLLTSRPPPPPEVAAAVREQQLVRAEKAVAKLRARGAQVLFVRAPSSGLWAEVERGGFPREQTWDALLARTGAPGVHFEDHPELQGLELPEWSHLSGRDAERFTEALLTILERDGIWQPPVAQR